MIIERLAFAIVFMFGVLLTLSDEHAFAGLLMIVGGLIGMLVFAKLVDMFEV